VTPSTSRRALLRFGGAAGLASLAGCRGLPIARPDLTLFLRNRDAERHRLHLELLREDRAERSEASVHGRVHRLAPRNAAGDSTPTSVVVPSRSYLVRVDLLDRSDVPATHYHYRPDCDGDVPEELYVELRGFGDRLGFEFERNTCGGDSLRY
jgi:hypothetical protein